MEGHMARKGVLGNFWEKDVHRSSFKKGEGSETEHFYWGKMVGERRFELPTSWSRTKRATRLRYSPDG